MQDSTINNPNGDIPPSGIAGREITEIEADPALGEVLGHRYRLIAPLGAGASARVYLADDLSLGRQVAVKCLRQALSDDSRFIRRFRAEAQAAARLSHPNLLAIYDWDEDGSSAFIVTEVLLGGSLLDLIERSGRITPSQGLLVALQVAQGLHYAHDLGWVHRDIKPANLLFGDEGRLRIADFGIARAVADAAWTEPEGQLVGTARYAAPEQAEGDAVDGKADVYALGLTIMEAITGTVPLLGETALATMVLRQGRDVPENADLGPLGEAILPTVRADPTARPTAAELIDALTRTARDLPRPRRLDLLRPNRQAAHPDTARSTPAGSAPSRGEPDPSVVDLRAGPGDRRRPASDDVQSRPIRRPAEVGSPSTGQPWLGTEQAPPVTFLDRQASTEQTRSGRAAPPGQEAAPSTTRRRSVLAAASDASTVSPVDTPAPRVTLDKRGESPATEQHTVERSAVEPDDRQSPALENPAPPPPAPQQPRGRGLRRQSSSGPNVAPWTRRRAVPEPPRPVRLTRLADENPITKVEVVDGIHFEQSEKPPRSEQSEKPPQSEQSEKPQRSEQSEPQRSEKRWQSERSEKPRPPRVFPNSPFGAIVGPTPETKTEPELDIPTDVDPNEAGSTDPDLADPGPASTRSADQDHDSSASAVDPDEPRWIIIGILLALILALLVAVIVIANRNDGETAAAPSSTAANTAATMTVADVVGVSLSDVELQADDHDWALSVSETRRNGTELGEVLEQDPAPGTPMEAGESLRLVVSLGPELSPLPIVVGRSTDEASKSLRQAGFTVGSIVDVEADAPVGEVVGVEFAGNAADEPLDLGTAIDLLVSGGPAAAPMPSFVGLTLERAVAQAEEFGLEVTTSDGYSERYDKGFVFDTDPPTDAPFQPGDTVNLVVSLGGALLTVPNVTGLTIDEARDTLTSAGFTVAGIFGRPDREVVATQPLIGEAHPRGTSITIYTRP